MTGEPVVVGIDGSAVSRAAARWAATEAVFRGVKLQLLHACAYPETELRRRQELLSAGDDPLLDLCCRALTEAEAAVKDAEPEVDVFTELRAGLTAEVLIEASRSASTLVVGSHGVGTMRGLVLGSVASAVATRAQCPVVVVRVPVPTSGPVVVGLDLATDDPVTWEYAFAEASRRGVPLLAVHAWHDTGETWSPDLARTEELGDRLAQWSARYPDIEVEWRVVRDRNPARALVTESAGAQLLVVGSRGRGQITAAVLGSTGASVLGRATCPVAIVRHRTES